jgi:hypothetical protein
MPEILTIDGAWYSSVGKNHNLNPLTLKVERNSDWAENHRFFNIF